MLGDPTLALLSDARDQSKGSPARRHTSTRRRNGNVAISATRSAWIARYCHGGGRPQETDVNPRKDIARKMILLVRQINREFPGTGVFPEGNQAVTCFTCHRGDPHPLSWSNIRYELPAPKQ